MIFDLETFQRKLLLSLGPDTPLQENLRAVVAPTLEKFRRYTGAKVALHFFLNLGLQELHVMAVGGSDRTRRALRAELERRHERNASLTPSPELPDYKRMQAPDWSVLTAIFDDRIEVRWVELDGPSLGLLKDVESQLGEEFAPDGPRLGDRVVVISLGAGPYRLGYVVLWSPSGVLANELAEPSRIEGLIAFRRATQELTVRVFSNFYRMTPNTYLPSYYRPESKVVTLFCTEIRNFDRISAILRERTDLEREEKEQVLRLLVNRFCEAAARLVEDYGGRVDQIWGSGLVAVFGEYIDSPEPTPRTPSKRALWAAADFVDEFRKLAENWLDKEFRRDSFRRYSNEYITLQLGVALDVGEVMFDYVGSHSRRVYMALGDRVSFVKRLASLGGRVRASLPVSADPLPGERVVAGEVCRADEQQGAPILLTQAAYGWAGEILVDLADRPHGEVHTLHLVSFPDHPGRFAVVPVWPGNVQRLSRG